MNSKLIKVLIIVAVVLFIVGIIVLVSLSKKNTKTSVSTVSTNDFNTSKVDTLEKKETVPTLDLNFISDNNEMKVGETYKVSLNLSSKEEIKLNAFDLYIKFDKEIFTVSNLIFNKDIPEPNFVKISDKKSVIATNFLFDEKEGISFFKGKETNILTFDVTPKKAGDSSFEVSTGDSQGDSITMFINKTTGKKIPFLGNLLNIKIVE